VETPSGQGWFAHFNSTGAFGRIVHLQPVEWVDDWPVMGKRLAGTYGGEPVAVHPMPDTGIAPTGDRLQDSDEFAAKSLGLQWSWNHNPDDKAWSLSARPGFLRLIAGKALQITTARNTLTQILQGPDRRITARLDVSGLTDGQRAGLSLFGVRPSWIGVVQEGGTRYLTLSSAGVETRGEALKGKSVQLRAEVTEDQKVRYAYSLDEGKSFQAFGEAIQLARFSWWKGSRPALFTFTKGEPGGVVDVDWMRLEPLSKGDAR
jgi:beta-xylosidase